MELIIDVGNSRTKWAVFRNGEIKTNGSFENSEAVPADITNLDSGIPVVVCSVSGISDQLSNAIHKFSSILEFGVETPVPIEIAYSSPQTLGSDRSANAVAAFSTFSGQNVLVIDVGTCITLDFIDNGGSYHGGSISPGLSMRFSALNNYTDALPLIEPSTPEHFIGRTTEESILIGVINGTKAELDGLIELYNKEFKHLAVVLTGGDHLWFDGTLKNETFADAFFTLRGLHAILEYNRTLP